ncbi:hypothetical protein SDC9_74513 [bioreactor metagenome]|uniref:Uncharacterized protein n=1 Tax=bioreactor metagenome TaxID=1076179 RepID=A0A644YHM2_9ZZZZ
MLAHLLDDRRGGTFWSKQCIPCHHIEASDPLFGHRLHARQHVAGMPGRNAQRLQLAARNMGARCRNRVDHQRNLAADGVGQCLPRGLVLHAKQRCVRHLHELRKHHVGRGAGQPHIQRLRPGLGVGDQLGHAVRWQIGHRGADHHGQQPDHRHRLEVRHRVVARAGVQKLVGGVRRVGAQQKGISVRHRFGRCCSADVATRACLVFHHHRLTEGGGKLLPEQAHQHVCTLPGRIGHDHADRLVRPWVLRLRGQPLQRTRRSH